MSKRKKPSEKEVQAVLRLKDELSRRIKETNENLHLLRRLIEKKEMSRSRALKGLENSIIRDRKII